MNYSPVQPAKLPELIYRRDGPLWAIGRNTLSPIEYSSKLLMKDQSLFEHIRRLVREQKSQQVLDVKQDNFAEEYCKFEMLKKKKSRNQENRINALFKNFKTVESYINIMDIIKNL